MSTLQLEHTQLTTDYECVRPGPPGASITAPLLMVTAVTLVFAFHAFLFYYLVPALR